MTIHERERPEDRARDEEERPVDATTILDNVVHLDELLDERSREELDQVPYLELSKHLKIRKTGS